MNVAFRRAVSALLIVSGLVLCGLAARHYVRGWQAQEEGRRVLEARSLASARAAEYPGIVPAAAAVPASQAESGGSAEAPAPGAIAAYPLGEPLARLKIPVARIDAVVFGGADQATLEKGPGHVPGTELPGAHTELNNCVITGHRDSHFRNLGWLRAGNEIELDAQDQKLKYRVVSREIVLPDAVRVLKPTASPRLTLITCYPFNYIGPAPKRLVVVAEPE